MKVTLKQFPCGAGEQGREQRPGTGEVTFPLHTVMCTCPCQWTHDFVPDVGRASGGTQKPHPDMEDCASDKGRATSHPPGRKELADYSHSPAACRMVPPGSASPSEEGLPLTQCARSSFSSVFGLGWQQMFLCPSVQMLRSWLWSAVCFVFCHFPPEPTDSTLLLEGHPVPSTEFKTKGEVSEERNLTPKCPNLNSSCTGILCTNEFPLPAQGFGTAMDPMCAQLGEGWMPALL